MRVNNRRVYVALLGERVNIQQVSARARPGCDTLIDILVGSFMPLQMSFEFQQPDE